MAKIKNLSLKILFVLLLIVTTFCFSACAEVRSMTITNQDGSIEEIVYLTLDKNQVVESGNNYLELQRQIENDCKNVATLILSDYAQRIEIDNMQKYAKRFDVLLSSKWVDDCYSIRLKFDDINVYNYYYGITDENDVEPTTEHHFLYDKISYVGYTSFAVDYSLVGKLKTYFEINYNEEILNLSNCKFYYTIEASSKREHSNADFVSRVDGKWYHTWQIDINQPNRQVKLYYNLANRGNCVMLCVLIGLGVCAILLFIGILLSIINKMKLKHHPTDESQVEQIGMQNETINEQNNDDSGQY